MTDRYNLDRYHDDDDDGAEADLESEDTPSGGFVGGGPNIDSKDSKSPG